MDAKEQLYWEVFAEFSHALWCLSQPGWPDMKHDWHWAMCRKGLGCE